MAKIQVTQFSGVSPRTPPRYLQEGQAQTAINCPAWNGSLTPLRDILPDDGSYFASDYVDSTYMEQVDTYTLPGGYAETIYLFGVSLGKRKWFQWPDDVDVVRGFISGDTTERTFFTRSGSKPQYTDQSMNTGSGPYPENSYDLSMPTPDTTLTAAVSGTASANAVPETRVYTYTWVNDVGDETMPFTTDPMPAAAFVDVADGQSVDLTLPSPPVGNFNITKRRIYRSAVAEDGSVEYLFVAEIPATDTTYNDAIDPSDLGEVCPSLTWNPVPDNLIGLVGMPNGVMAGFIEGGRDVYFSDPYHPYAWPVDYMQTVKYKIIGLGVIDTTLVVLTDGKPVIIQGSHPDSMVQVEPDFHQACVSKRSIVEIMGAIFYASPDGLVRVSSSGSELITRDLFAKEQWALLKPSSIHAYSHERRYVAFYDSPNYGKGGFVFDVERGVFVFHDRTADCGFSALEDDKLYLAQSDVIAAWNAGDPLTFQWRSKKFTMPRETGMSALRVDTEGSGIKCAVYRDGVLIFNQDITSKQLYRLPAGKGRDWEIELIGNEEVYQIGIAQSPAELGGG